MAYSSASSTSTNPRVTPTATEHLHDLVIIPTARMGAPPRRRQQQQQLKRGRALRMTTVTSCLWCQLLCQQQSLLEMWAPLLPDPAVFEM